MWTRGIPDFSVSLGRTTLWFEVKVWMNKPTKIQAYFLKRLGAGGFLIVADAFGRTAYIESGLGFVNFRPVKVLVEEIIFRCLNA